MFTITTDTPHHNWPTVPQQYHQRASPSRCSPARQSTIILIIRFTHHHHHHHYHMLLSLISMQHFHRTPSDQCTGHAQAQFPSAYQNLPEYQQNNIPTARCNGINRPIADWSMRQVIEERSSFVIRQAMSFVRSNDNEGRQAYQQLKIIWYIYDDTRWHWPGHYSIIHTS